MAFVTDTDLAGTATGQGADMVGFSQRTTGATASTVTDELRHFVRPEQFGAIGDGTTDDTAAIQAAIDAAADWPSAGSARVVLLSSYYKTTDTLLKRPYVSIAGIGFGRSGLRPAMSSGPAIDCDAVVNDSSLQYDDLTNFGINGADATADAYALRVRGQKHGRLQRIAFLNFTNTNEHVLQIVDSCYSIVLEQCYFLNNLKHEKIAATDIEELGFPTTILHRACVYDDSPASTAEAILIEDASGCTWDKDCVFQSNRQKYLFLIKSGSEPTTTHAHVWDGCYIEQNGNGQSGAQTWRFEGDGDYPLTGCRIAHPKIHGDAPDGRHIHASNTDLLSVHAIAFGHAWLADGGGNIRYDIDARHVGACDLQSHGYSLSHVTFTAAETITYSQGIQAFVVTKQAVGIFDVALSRAFDAAAAATTQVFARDVNGEPLLAAAYMSDAQTLRVTTWTKRCAELADPGRVELAVQGQVVGL